MTKLKNVKMDICRITKSKNCQKSLIFECEDRTGAAGWEDREEFIMNFNFSSSRWQGEILLDF